jgi:alpha-glucuronidase
MVRAAWRVAFAAVAVLGTRSAAAESGADAWLRYPFISDPAVRSRYDAVPGTVVTLGSSILLRTARDELVQGLGSMLHRTPVIADTLGPGDALVLGPTERIREAIPAIDVPEPSALDGFSIAMLANRERRLIVIAGRGDRGALYGTFALLRRVALHQPLAGMSEMEAPAAPLRWVNEWNNLDGSIERGYGGRSIFFEAGHVVGDLTLVRAYARLLASIGVNACAVNNVNADPRVLASAFVPDLARLADAFRPWGVRLAIAVDFSSPQRVGGLDTFDPLDARVAAFWSDRAADLYRAVPDFAGFVLKADSEGRLGPSAYGRTHADAANVIARALAPHGGVLFYRGFVYDHHMDWRDPKNDRARAAYDNFHDLDGRFDDNVVLQIKHGPIDFQVREPASPLFGALARTNQAIELQITQEYTGQQRHVCFLVPMWKDVLDFDMRVDGGATPVKALVAGRTRARPLGGFVGVSNVGRSGNWLGHDLAVANLYGFGRLAWNADLSAARIADEWTRLTFGDGHRVVETITGILLESWPAYERYTGPLGAGTLTDIINAHYGPGVESSERNGWGQWHRADHEGIGMDRTMATGTKYIAQYSPQVAAMYESLETVPDNLLLFMHHVPYTHRLKAGGTVIQHIYDAHYQGADEAAQFVDRWRQLADAIDSDRYAAVLEKLQYQSGHAIVWRDAVVSWFLRESGIPDARGRAGHAADRIEAESMTLNGYVVEPVTPWETASGGRAAACPGARTCAASFRFPGTDGVYTIAVLFFDESDGQSAYRMFVGEREIGRWRASGDLPSSTPNGHTATRRLVGHAQIRRGETIRVEGTPDGGERAVVDYIEITPGTSEK